jgi:hypothetical protein
MRQYVPVGLLKVEPLTSIDFVAILAQPTPRWPCRHPSESHLIGSRCSELTLLGHDHLEHTDQIMSVRELMRIMSFRVRFSFSPRVVWIVSSSRPQDDYEVVGSRADQYRQVSVRPYLPWCSVSIESFPRRSGMLFRLYLPNVSPLKSARSLSKSTKGSSRKLMPLKQMPGRPCPIIETMVSVCGNRRKTRPDNFYPPARVRKRSLS